jgi:hypothetical protein
VAAISRVPPGNIHKQTPLGLIALIDQRRHYDDVDSPQGISVSGVVARRS